MTSDPGFRAARKAGAQGAFRLFFPPLFLLGFLVLLTGPFSSGEGFGTSTPFLVVAVIVAVIVLSIFATRARRWSRNRSAWSRAARGAVSLTLRGEAVAAERKVSGRPMRTVVVEHRGSRQYLHLLFAPGAPVEIMGPGWVTVEFFAGDTVEGPARLLLADGRTLWAYTSQLGTRVPPMPRATRPSGATSSDGSAALLAPVAFGPGAPGDRERDDDGGGAGSGDAVPSPASSPDPSASAAWSGGDGWTGGSSWGGDSTWTGSDGGGHSGGGSDGGGGGWFGGGDSGGWSGGDSGGGGGDSGGGSS